MKNFWGRRQMINRASYLCCVRVPVLPHSKQYSTSWITLNASMGKYVFKQFGRTSLKVRSAISSVMMPTLDFGLHIHKNMQSLSKKEITLQHNVKWNYSNFCTLSSWACRLQTRALFAQLFSQINDKLSQTWKNKRSNKCNSNKHKHNNKKRWIMLRLCNCIANLK